MIETIELPMKESTKNLFRVHSSQWRKWSTAGHKTFNGLYSAMLTGSQHFAHPKQDKIPLRRWKTTCWNAAWIAADLASGH